MRSRPTRICVFAGSSAGGDPSFAAAAHELGEQLARRGLGLVFGGEALGLMGAVAGGALAGGGEVIGIVPRALPGSGVPYPGVDLRIVDTLAERKQSMLELADGFIALPGGLGTLDELTEVITWTQLGVHSKHAVLLDVADYWLPFARLLDAMVAGGFLRPAARELLRFERSPVTAIDAALAG
jgi:uncharacterized protein (TIGR00730 family)